MTSNESEQQKVLTSSMTVRASKRGLAYFATAGLILLNVGFFGVSILMALLSLMMFDAPDTSMSSAAWVSFTLLFTMPVPLGAAVCGSILLHGKERFWAIVMVTFFSAVYFVIPYSLMIFW